MHADIDGAVRIARLAAEFDWTGKVNDLEPFCAAAGWELVQGEDISPWIRTDFAVNSPVAPVHLMKRQIDLVSIYATDLADPEAPYTLVEREVNDCFVELGQALTDTLGTPTRREAGDDAMLGWDLPKIVIRLTASDAIVVLELVSRQYQAELDEYREEDDD
ncbi:DUF6301 family protein [Nocardia sp. NPDC052566]|uniref:DUF6301 family protein n=1 Tax=Nocardia sp. NPDC052566 TaxID=3364330 RepID=UPI0037CC6242